MTRLATLVTLRPPAKVAELVDTQRGAWGFPPPER